MAQAAQETKQTQQKELSDAIPYTNNLRPNNKHRPFKTLANSALGCLCLLMLLHHVWSILKPHNNIRSITILIFVLQTNKQTNNKTTGTPCPSRPTLTQPRSVTT
jgi:hypothetical protein